VIGAAKARVELGLVEDSRDELDALEPKLDTLGGLLLLCEHVDARAEGVGDVALALSGSFSTVFNSMRPECDEQPAAMVRLVLAVDVQNALMRPSSAICPIQPSWVWEVSTSASVFGYAS
jgi:hypothetical protein